MIYSFETSYLYTLLITNAITEINLKIEKYSLFVIGRIKDV